MKLSLSSELGSTLIAGGMIDISNFPLILKEA